MNGFLRPLSAVREQSQFVTPPHILVMADDDGACEAVALAEALDANGADAEVRLGETVPEDGHLEPDAVIVPWTATESDSGFATVPSRSVRVAVTDGNNWGEQGRARAAGFDLVVSRPVNVSALMEKLGGYLPRLRM